MEPLILKTSTPAVWVDAVLGDWPAFLRDHASCERKAMATAMSLISRYPDREALVEPMICLAKEELAHYHDVYRLLLRFDVSLPTQESDPYVKRFMKHIRHPDDEHLLDKLLICSLIEARSSERFEILATALEDPDLREFYSKLAKSERGHWKIFYRIAGFYFEKPEVEARFEKLLTIESQCMLDTPIRAAVH